MSDYKIKPKELAGFSLAGYVQPSGVIRLVGSDRYIDAWPKEIALNSNTFELEEIIKGSTDPETGEQFQNAEYC